MEELLQEIEAVLAGEAEVIGEIVISTDGDIRKYYDDSSIERME